jgi:hypothetical protein
MRADRRDRYGRIQGKKWRHPRLCSGIEDSLTKKGLRTWRSPSRGLDRLDSEHLSHALVKAVRAPARHYQTMRPSEAEPLAGLGRSLARFRRAEAVGFCGNRYCGGSQLPFTHLQLGPG